MVNFWKIICKSLYRIFQTKKMGKTEEKAKDVIKKLTQENKTIDEVKALYPGDQEWFSVSNKAYNIRLEEAKRENKKNETRPHVSSTSNAKIADIIDLNEKLSDF